MIPKETLVYDIETKTNGSAPGDVEKHTLRWFAAYSYLTDETHFIDYRERDKIQKIINKHKYLVGFNNLYYDNAVLKNDGFNLKYKLFIDLFKGVMDRDKHIKFKNSILAYHLDNYTLNTITKTLGLVDEQSGKIEDFDYSLFNKDDMSTEEYNYCKEYTVRDIKITVKLWEWYFDLFDSWKYHLNFEDSRKLKHLSSSISAYTYKVLCNKTGLPEVYSEYKFNEYKKSEGGFVSYPAREKTLGKIYCMDFSSLYPHIMIQCNIYGRNKTADVGWHGGEQFVVEGYYNNEEMHMVSKTLHEMYLERRELKKNNDPREMGLKVALNTAYGILRSPLFKSVYDDIAGNDVCLLGQQFIKLARKRFKDAGYDVIYSDTDSIFLIDIFDDEKKMLNQKQKIMHEIKSHLPFAVDSFDMDIDYRISMLHFFFRDEKTKDEEEELDEFKKQYMLMEDFSDEDDVKHRETGLMKKNYLFVYEDNRKENVFIKNLGIVKRNNTKLSKKIFWEKMVPSIIEKKECKFSQFLIKDWVDEYLKESISYISKRFSIKSLDKYKNQSSIYAQIHEYIPKDKQFKLGPGTHFMIPNIKFGVGKSFPKYCTIEEYREHLKSDSLDIGTVKHELRYFTSEYEPRIFKPKKWISFMKKTFQAPLNFKNT